MADCEEGAEDAVLRTSPQKELTAKELRKNDIAS